MGAKNSRRLSRAGGLEIDYDKQENKIIPRPFDEDGAKVLHINEERKDPHHAVEVYSIQLTQVLKRLPYYPIDFSSCRLSSHSRNLYSKEQNEQADHKDDSSLWI